MGLLMKKNNSEQQQVTVGLKSKSLYSVLIFTFFEEQGKSYDAHSVKKINTIVLYFAVLLLAMKPEI